MDNDLIGLIGLCRKAGQAEAGEESVTTAAKGHKARLLLLASDAGDRTQRHAEALSTEGNCPLLPAPLTKAELGQAVGKSSCAILALTDVGLAAAVVKRLARNDPEGCKEILGRLEYKAEKTLRRRRETRQREKAAQTGQKKPWAAPSRQRKPS